MRAWTSLLTLSIFIACDGGANTDCSLAVQQVTDCYGDEIGAAFAESCTAELASAALADTCAGPDGKEDIFSTPILSPQVEQFKYGSIGADKMGLPLSVLRALPVICSDLLPAGTDPLHQPYAAFGMIYEPGRKIPIGFSSRRMPLIGTVLTGTTCSACHTSTVRATPTSERTVYFGAPNIRFDLEAYTKFVFACVTGPRFTSSNLNRAFDKLGITGFDRLVPLGSFYIRSTVAGLEKQIGGIIVDGPWGPGRDDAIALSAATLLGHEHLPSIPAPVDFPAVWNQAARAGHALHWDGAAGTAFERNVLVAIGAGAPQSSLPFTSIQAIQTWLEQLPPPKYPFAIDTALAAQGEAIFDQHCLSCHGGTRTWEVTPIDEIQTDRNRIDCISQPGVDKLNSLSGPGWAMDNFKKTNGYLNSLLDGIWLRAPYLHNGSVPTLRDLLSPPELRPKVFYRGNDTFDQVNIGFVSDLAQEGVTSYARIDTSREGNGNGGHAYGTDLSPEQKDALLEFLKTL